MRPRDLLPVDVRHARIMAFDYEADARNFFSTESQSSIFQHAQNLLQDLQRERHTSEEVSFLLHQIVLLSTP